MTASNAALFDTLLDTSVSSPSPGHGAAIKATNAIYGKLVAKGNLSSYSQDTVFHACPRKYAIKKMQADAGTADRMNSPTFAFGHAVGAGVAIYDQTLDTRAAIWATFLAWDIDLLELETNKSGKLTGKSFHEAVWAIYAYRTFHAEETPLVDYEVIKIEGTVAVDFEDGHYYVGHIDEVLRHRGTGRYLVKENKTTGLNVVDPCLYSNSDQALSYAIVIDMLGGAEYEVLYTIYSCGTQEWIQYFFVKTANSKAAWIQDQLLMNQHRDDYEKAKFWPMRGASCFMYMRRCEFYGSCDFALDTVYGKDYSDLPKVTTLAEIEAIEHIDFPTTLTAIIARQKEKLNLP